MMPATHVALLIAILSNNYFRSKFSKKTMITKRTPPHPTGPPQINVSISTPNEQKLRQCQKIPN